MPENEHLDMRENIRELCEFKRDMTISSTGVIDRIWGAIEKKASRSLLIAFSVVLVTLVTSLFGLVYHSNSKVLHEMVSVKSNIALIMETLK